MKDIPGSTYGKWQRIFLFLSETLKGRRFFDLSENSVYSEIHLKHGFH